MNGVGNSRQMIMEKVKDGKFSFSNEEWNVISNEAKLMISKMLQRGIKL